MKALVLVLSVGFMALGCQKSEPPPPLAASAAPAAASAPVAAADSAPAVATDTAVPPVATAEPPAVAAAVKSVPTEADYEVQEQTAITPANAAQVLAAIEKQVGQ
jgi:hypothetical protein